MNYNNYFLIVHVLFSFCLCEISDNKKLKLLEGFRNYYDNLPDQSYASVEGSLQSTEQVDATTYQIVVNLKVKQLSNVDITKLLQCTATVQNSDEEHAQITVVNNQCQEHEQQSPSDTGSQVQTTESQVEVIETIIERKPVQLDNEVQQMNIDITSGEQFIAVPRDQPSAPCVGCASHVNPQAAGVSDLANLGVRHLNIHEPSVKHTLDSVLDVQRQVQVVNGVRYILTLLINSNSCFEAESENCITSKTCKITVLVKPWVKLPSGANYKAILANNCTEEWQYGDNGEVLPELATGNASNDNIQVRHNNDVQSQPNQERLLTDEELKSLQEQIIPNSEFQQFTQSDHKLITTSPGKLGEDKQHVYKIESVKHNENTIPITESGKIEQQTTKINPEKKKAIDEMLDFFDFSGYKPRTETEKEISRVKRNYDYDLQILSLAEDFHDIKKSIENAKFVYEMAQAMVDYLNEMDMEVKNRVVKNVIKAEEEIENFQRFMYLQAHVTIPCDKVECEPKDVVTQICNGVIDSTNKNIPQILNTFCYNDNKERDYRDVIKVVPVDDPVLQTLAIEALKKIESDSNYKHAMKINKIVAANTQVTSGTLTKISMIIESINCNKSVPLALRVNSTVLEQLGSKICEVLIHERHWLKERKISYICTDRPTHMRISKTKSVDKHVTVNDPKVNEMLQEAIQYLETQSNRNNKQKIVNIKSISSQIVAGFLTKIEFVIGYTNCTNENQENELFKCELLKNEGLRLCKAQIWDRSWIMDGRQVEVSCDDVTKSNEIEKTKKKRSVDFLRDQVEESAYNNKLDYKKIANECLKKFMQSSPSRQHYEVVKIERVNVREVSGKLTKIDFTISPTNCLISIDGLPSFSKCEIVNPKNISRCHSKILEQVWLDKKQYAINCDINDGNLQIKTDLDGFKERDPNDSKYYKLAEESLKKYLHDTGNSSNHRIVRVEKVTTQVVSGLLTSIDFIISPENESDSGNGIRCRSKILEKRWLGTRDLNVSCNIQENKNIDDLTEQNSDNPKYMQIAVESLQKYIKNNPDSNLIRVSFIDKVIPQAGGITELRFIASGAEDDNGDSFCHAVYSEKRYDIKVKCYFFGKIHKKTDISDNDPNYFKYVELADESFHHYLQSTNSSLLYTIISIENITVLWDEGIKTLIDFIVSPVDLDSNEMQGKRCNSQILEQPWLHKKHFDVKCEVDKELYRTKRELSNDRVKRQLGAIIVQNTTNPKYKKLADQSLRKYVKDSAITQILKVHLINKVTTQVVAGLITNIDFSVSDSQDSIVVHCHSKIWEHPWLDEKDIELSCQNLTKRAKRDTLVLNGLREEDPSDPQYKALAEESLRKYEQETGSPQSHEIVSVEKVTSQVVAGSMIRIYFIVSDRQDLSIIKCHSEVWIRSWLNKKEITVSCQNGNRRDLLPNSFFEEDPSDPQYKALAEESLRKYEQDSRGYESFKLVRLERVTKQYVAGYIILIEFIASGSLNTLKCISEVWIQSWLDKKEITVYCNGMDRLPEQNYSYGDQNGQDLNDPKYKSLAEESLSKYTQDFGRNEIVKRRSGMPGGVMEQDPTDPKYIVLAEESLRKYEQDSEGRQFFELVRVEKVTSQIVAGLLTRIAFLASEKQGSNFLKCESKILEQAWLNIKNIEVTCQKDNKIVKRHIFMPGGAVEQDRTDPQYKVLAEESLQKYVQQSGLHSQTLKVQWVERVTTQVVSGVITRIYFVVSGGQGHNVMKCQSAILEQPWLSNRNIDVTCQNANEKVKRDTGTLGGLTEQDPTDSKYKVLAEESLRKYEQESGSRQSLELVRVEKVTTQIVAGLLTRISFLASEKQGSESLKCQSKILEQAWLHNKNIEVTCQKDNKIVKRHIDMPGGAVEQDPTDPQYKVLAEESLQKYVQQSGLHSQTLKVQWVERVTTQVVSGVITRIYFVVSGDQGHNVMKCQSTVLEQSWLSNRNIDVTCQNANERVKRDIGMPGGLTEQDPTDSKYKVLAEESLRKYEQESGSRQSLELVRVEKVTTQIVGGLLTRISFLASEKQGSDSLKCQSKILEQAWLNNKNIEVTCQKDNKIVKRQIDMPGGAVEQDPTDPQYKVLAEESLQKYVQQSGLHSQTLKVQWVERVTTQVVSGVITRIYFVVSGDQGHNVMKCQSAVLEQSWLSNRNIDVTCQNANERVKRDTGMPGGLKEQDPTDSKYKVLAEESLRKYEQESGSRQSLELVRVEKVTTQIVAGLLTRISFLASEKQGSDSLKCQSKILEQAWLNNKNIEVTCQKHNKIVKRQIDMPGGAVKQDPTDPQYKVLAEESLQKYVQQSGLHSQTLKVQWVERVTTQVVSGVITRIYFVVSGGQGQNVMKCQSAILEQPWLSNRNIDVTCQNANEKVKRDTGTLGGLTEQDPTDSKYKVLAEESLRKYEQESGSRQSLELVRVEKVTTQIVAGLLTRISFLASEKQGSESLKCQSKILEQAWLHNKNIEVTCQKDNKIVKRHIDMPGGAVEHDPTDPQYKVLAEESLQKYVQQSGLHSQTLKVQWVERVTTQVVSGAITRIYFVVSGGQGHNVMKCQSAILEQPWLSNRNIDVTCQNANERVKRDTGMLGGLTEQDPTDSKYKVLAEESLRKYEQESGSRQSLEIIRVEKVTTQVVAGLLTRIMFLASEKQGSNPLKCHSAVWEKAWLNNKNIEVTCQKDNKIVKRHIDMPGGAVEHDPTDPRYKVLAEESLQKYVQQSGLDAQTLKVHQVERVTTQVVSGVITRIYFVVSGGQGHNVMKCQSAILEQSWLSNRNIDVTCQNANERVKRDTGMLGGLTEQDPTDSKYKVLAEESLRKYEQESGSRQSLEIIRVEKVTTQVVAGLLTRIMFLASEKPGSNPLKCHSAVWEKAWLNMKNIEVTCQKDNKIVKRHIDMPGGTVEHDPTDPRYKVLAEESLQKYVQQSGLDAQTLKVHQVERVTTQVVSGVITRIYFVVSGGQGHNVMKCQSAILEQSWLSNRNIDVTCQNANERVKRDTGMLGGLTEQDPTDSKYKVLAEESLRKYKQESGSRQSLEIIRVEKVTTQVVAGLLTRIMFLASEKQGSNPLKCHSAVWEKAWLNMKNIEVTCQKDNKIVKRHIDMAGGAVEQDPTDPQYKVLAEESLQKYVQQSGLDSQTLKVQQVERVTTQVVSGVITRIYFVVSGGQGHNVMKCQSAILEQPWLSNRNIDVTCQNANERVKRDTGILGGLTEQDPTDSKYKVLAEESLLKYEQESGSRQSLELVRVEKVTTQIVAGLLTRIAFLVSEKQGSNSLKCQSKILEQAWLNNKNIEVTCQKDNKIVKRHIDMAGGAVEQDPTDPQYKVLAEESLQKYVQQSGLDSQTLKVQQVERVTTQVVSGVITRIYFVVSRGQGHNVMKCQSAILEQPWLSNRNIDVTCQNANERVKRDTGMLGGLTDQDPTDSKYKVLAEESLRKYEQESGSRQSIELVRVEKVTTQIVAGLLTRIAFLASEKQGSNSLKCQSKILEQAWLNNKNIEVTCQKDNGRVKREIGGDKLHRKEREIIQGNSDSKVQLPVGVLRGQVEEEQDPNKREYKLLAEESLRKYEQKSAIHHKVVEMKRVVVRVVSGFKYKIDFTAAPTECSANVSKIRERSCDPIDDVILYCHTEIWDRPWLKLKKINVECQTPDDDDFEDYGSDFDAADTSLKPSVNENKSNNDKNYKLVEEATEKYLKSSKRKYVHKVTDIHSVSEHIADGTITKIDFSISPTKCLRNVTKSSILTCEMKRPLIVLHCNAKIWDRPWLHIDKDIKVSCKKVNKQTKQKRELGVRVTRQIGDDDDEIDEDTTYYYADRAVQHINDQSNSNNLHKLITIHAVQNSVQMDTLMVRMYIEIAETFCLRHHREVKLFDCEEMDGLNHRLCLARLWPSSDDELVVRHVSVVCDDDDEFDSITGLNIPELLKLSIADLERSPDNAFKLVHQGEPQVIPSLDSKLPVKINFIIATTNCSKDVNLNKNPFQCYIDTTIPSKACHSFIWLSAETRFIRYINAKCTPTVRSRRSLLDAANLTSDNSEIQKFVMASLEKLEMSSLHRYKQRVLQINSYSTKITTGKVTTIDFDVGYTSCLKYEWVENITTCDFLEHLPRRHCVAQVWERLWINNGKNIDVNCVDDETPLETHIEFESAEMANQLAREALKHIEAKYPHPKKQKVVRIFSLEKQVVAGIHYRMKVEVGFTDCIALSDQTDCKLEKNIGLNKFCRVNVWVRPWTDHPPNFRVSCDFQEGATHDLYHHVQAEQLFYHFLTTYSPSYVNDYSQMQKRFDIFKTNINKIHEFNVHEKGTARYGVTRFTDLTYEEFSSQYMGLKTSMRDENQLPMKKADIPDIKLPENFDWREYDAVTEVKDQGSCGSCWAFSVTGNIEGQWKMQSGHLVSLSEQELVDCDKLDDGCNGGLPDNAYRAIEQLGGLELESDYPYEGEDEKCEFNKTLAKVQISGAVNITANETGMAQWLVHNGPISIGINANAMQFYMGGISHPWKMLCNPTNLDHGVLIVGYGIKDYPLFHKKLPYWIVKNSWGKSWGEQGYYRVYRGDGTCGVNQMASSAVI